MIPTLIDKQDTFEIVRDKIAVILANESANQVTLATTAGKPNPDDWKLRVFLERTNPWEQFENDPADVSPLINVWFDNSNFDLGASNVMERQKSDGVFNIDCYGYGKSKDDGGTGHEPGDRAAAIEVQKAIRFVRNILMAAEYTYLDLRGIVSSRSFRSITVFQPQLDGRNVQHVIGARLACNAAFNEFSPQVEGETLELVSVDVKRAENGEVLAEADYVYPIT